jgi:hypothetical protein
LEGQNEPGQAPGISCCCHSWHAQHCPQLPSCEVPKAEAAARGLACSIGVNEVSAAGGILPQQRKGGLPRAVLRLLVQQQQAVPHKAAGMGKETWWMGVVSLERCTGMRWLNGNPSGRFKQQSIYILYIAMQHRAAWARTSLAAWPPSPGRQACSGRLAAAGSGASPAASPAARRRPRRG